MDMYMVTYNLYHGKQWDNAINQSWEKINFRIKRSSMFFVNQKYELEPCLAISLR